MERSQIYEIIKSLKHRNFKQPEATSENYKLYWETACRVGIFDDNRYPYLACVENIIKDNEFRDKPLWQQGNRQSLTYRTNRVEENLQSICGTFKNMSFSRFVWAVRAERWQIIGYVIAGEYVEAEQLGKLMYAALGSNSISVDRSPTLPVWPGDNSAFIRLMNSSILEIREEQKRLKNRINEMNIEIDQLQTKAEFLTLNLCAFEE